MKKTTSDSDGYAPVPHDHEAMVKDALKNPAFAKAWSEPDPEMETLDVFPRARKSAGLTQADVAQRMGVSQPVVGRIESPGKRHSPSLNTLRRYAAAVGRDLSFKLVPRS